MLLYYLRHADPIYNPDSLTPLGTRQAEALAHRLAQHGIDKIYASSSQRAQDTARPCAEILKKDVTLLDWAHEGTHYREASVPLEGGGATWAMHSEKYRRIFSSNEVRELGEKWYTHEAFAGLTIGEGIKRIQREADAFLLSLGYEHDRENNCYKAVRPNHDRIALFAHQGFGIAFLSSILDIPYPMFCTHFDINHSSMTVIKFGDEGTEHSGNVDHILPMTLSLSNDSHLYADNLPTKFGNSYYI